MKVLQKQLQFIGLGLWIMLFIAIAIAWWSGKGDAKSLLLNISASVIAAFAFYWMIDVLRRTREAVALAPYVIKQINDLKGDVLAVCQEAVRIAGNTLAPDGKFNKADAQPSFQQIHFSTPANMQFIDGQQATFLQYMEERARRNHKCLENLLQVSRFLEAEAMAYIADIQSSVYLMHIAMTAAIAAKGRLNQQSSILVFLDPLEEHYQTILQLETWAKRNLLF